MQKPRAQVRSGLVCFRKNDLFQMIPLRRKEWRLAEQGFDDASGHINQPPVSQGGFEGCVGFKNYLYG
jgi:hypothetical protein